MRQNRLGMIVATAAMALSFMTALTGCNRKEEALAPAAQEAEDQAQEAAATEVAAVTEATVEEAKPVEAASAETPAADAGSTVSESLSPVSGETPNRPDRLPVEGEIPPGIPEVGQPAVPGGEAPAMPGGAPPAMPEEGEGMTEGNVQPGGLPDAAIAPNGNVRVLVTFKEGVSVEDGLAIISNEILNGAACDVNRRDDAAREASITVTQEQAELMHTCTVIESAKAQMQMPMH